MSEERAPEAQLSQDRANVWDGEAWQPAVYSENGAFVWDGKIWREVHQRMAPQTSWGWLEFQVSFEVGDQEFHTVMFLFQHQVDHVIITVDGQRVVEETLRGKRWWAVVDDMVLQTRPFGEETRWSGKQQFPFTVGDVEKHSLIIELEQKTATLKIHTCLARVWLDGRFFGQTDGSTWVPAQ